MAKKVSTLAAIALCGLVAVSCGSYVDWNVAIAYDLYATRLDSLTGGGAEIFRLEADPDATITANSADYDDGADFSTFGAPNRWASQGFGKLRSVVTPATGASLKVLAPNGDEAFAMGDIVDVKWESSAVTEAVRVEFSIDNGYSWTEVYPANVGNTGSYKWLVPLVDAPQALVRVSSTTRPAVYDVSDKPFTIVSSPLASAMTSFFGFAL